MKQIIEKARSSLSNNSLSHQTLGKCLRENFILLHLNIIIVFYLELLYNYPSSIVTLSLICNITSNTFIIEQIKSFLLHKKDQLHYFVSQYISLSFHHLFSFFIDTTIALYTSTSKCHFIIMISSTLFFLVYRHYHLFNSDL
jgi:hypothetical protein